MGQLMPDTRLPPCPTGRGSLLSDLSKYISLVDSDKSNIRLVTHLIREVLNKAPGLKIWRTVKNLMIESTPPPRQRSNLDQTPHSFNISSFVNAFECRKHVDDVLKVELGSSLHIEAPGFYEAFFRELTGLKTVASNVCITKRIVLRFPTACRQPQ